MSEETTPNQNPPEEVASVSQESEEASAAAPKDVAAKTTAAPKKEKAPAVENKPFVEFMQQDCLPALKSAFSKQGIEDIELSLEKKKIPIAGFNAAEECWQAIGRWQGGKRQFNLYFPKADINGPKAFSCSDSGAQPSTLEPFLIDERKITLDLLVFGVIQRLNAQKWLARN